MIGNVIDSEADDGGGNLGMVRAACRAWALVVLVSCPARKGEWLVPLGA